jgi:hypothetical protein
MGGFIVRRDWNYVVSEVQCQSIIPYVELEIIIKEIVFDFGRNINNNNKTSWLRITKKFGKIGKLVRL